MILLVPANHSDSKNSGHLMLALGALILNYAHSWAQLYKGVKWCFQVARQQAMKSHLKESQGKKCLARKNINSDAKSSCNIMN